MSIMPLPPTEQFQTEQMVATRYPARLHSVVCQRITERFVEEGELSIGEAFLIRPWDAGDDIAEYVRLNNGRVEVAPEEGAWELVRDRAFADYLTDAEFEADYRVELAVEQAIAHYILGVLVLDGALNPRHYLVQSTGKEGLSYCAERIAEALRDGVGAFGWKHGMKELLRAADVGALNGWKPKDQPREGESAL